LSISIEIKPAYNCSNPYPKIIGNKPTALLNALVLDYSQYWSSKCHISRPTLSFPNILDFGIIANQLLAVWFLCKQLYQFKKVWQHFFELKSKLSKVFKTKNGYAIFSFGISWGETIFVAW